MFKQLTSGDEAAVSKLKSLLDGTDENSIEAACAEINRGESKAAEVEEMEKQIFELEMELDMKDAELARKDAKIAQLENQVCSQIVTNK